MLEIEGYAFVLSLIRITMVIPVYRGVFGMHVSYVIS